MERPSVLREHGAIGGGLYTKAGNFSAVKTYKLLVQRKCFYLQGIILLTLYPLPLRFGKWIDVKVALKLGGNSFCHNHRATSTFHKKCCYTGWPLEKQKICQTAIYFHKE